VRWALERAVTLSLSLRFLFVVIAEIVLKKKKSASSAESERCPGWRIFRPCPRPFLRALEQFSECGFVHGQSSVSRGSSMYSARPTVCTSICTVCIQQPLTLMSGLQLPLQLIATIPLFSDQRIANISSRLYSFGSFPLLYITYWDAGFLPVLEANVVLSVTPEYLLIHPSTSRCHTSEFSGFSTHCTTSLALRVS
jgi:hypothetical protein